MTTDREINNMLKALRKSGRFVFAFKFDDEQRKLPEDRQAAILKTAFEKHLQAYFQNAGIETVATYSNEPERL